MIGTLADVKVSFFSLPYKLLERPLKNQNLRVAMPLDLAVMKILAISDRGTKRDFVEWREVKKFFSNQKLTLAKKFFGLRQSFDRGYE